MIIKYLSDSLYINESDIIRFSQTAPHRYKVYEIPKRNSDQTRTIAHPSKELKFIQRLLVVFLQDVLTTHESAYAYKNDISIKDNAAQHSDSKYLLKMDFQNFFPSITPEIFFKSTEKYGLNFDDKDMLVLTGLLFWRKKGSRKLVLSIGAPTSPMISNFIMKSFDEEMQNECSNKKIVYTRYADDITFSTKIKGILFDIPRNVESCLIKNFEQEIKINKEKTIFTSKAHNRHVTGITITNEGSLSIGREKKRLISSMIHKSKMNLLSKDETSVLQGLISFACHIEPSFYQRMAKKYGIDVLNSIKSCRC